MSNEPGHPVRRLPHRYDRPLHKVAPLHLTALLALAFVLLLVCLITAGFALPEGVLPAELPVAQSGDDTTTPVLPLIIRLRAVNKDGVYVQVAGIDHAPANYDELANLLYAMQQNSGGSNAVYGADDPVIIEPDPTVKWEHAVNALNAARRAGFTHVSFGNFNVDAAPPAHADP
ncbi:MAG: hypothetical protein GC159_23395 [Phycisphaera sp.]|nr:hypothetical protein [Phycisphaera sp.]